MIKIKEACAVFLPDLNTMLHIKISLLSLMYWCLQMLVVQENSGRFQGTGIWKIPTGVVDEVHHGEISALHFQ